MSTNTDEVATLSEKLYRTLGAGFTALSISLGVELGLFKTMAGYIRPQTSTQIAEDAGCKERYVREWLNLLVQSDWVTYEESTRKYFMSPAQKEVLTSPFSLFVPVIKHGGDFYGQLCESFRAEGPNGYNPKGVFNGRLADWMTLTDNDDVVNGYMDAMPEVWSRIVQGAKVCEIGCGGGSLLSVMAKKYPQSTYIGMDRCPNIISRATSKFVNAARQTFHSKFMTPQNFRLNGQNHLTS